MTLGREVCFRRRRVSTFSFFEEKTCSLTVTVNCYRYQARHLLDLYTPHTACFDLLVDKPLAYWFRLVLLCGKWKGTLFFVVFVFLFENESFKTSFVVLESFESKEVLEK